MHWFEDFEARNLDVNGCRVFARVSRGVCGQRPALLLLHGFPQTHAMWQRVAQALVNDFYLVMPDLRGYGDSAKPPGDADHANYSKRAMAQDLVALMDSLGVQRFGLCGHDRGARVAHRLALDQPQRVSRLALIDIAPTLDMYAATDFDFARAYYHWFHLIQPAPLPETMIGTTPAAALAYLHHKLGGWGSTGLGHIEPAALAEYERCFIQPETIHAVCEDYRASAGIDLVHDRASRELQATGSGKIACDTLVLWGSRGVVNRLFDPVDLWQAQCAGQVTGLCLEAGHFIPEELPAETARALADFLQSP
jgi:haloacetate dehalogenase